MFWKQQNSTASCIQTNTVQTNNSSNYSSKLQNGFHPIPEELVQQQQQYQYQQSNIQKQNFNTLPALNSTNMSPLKSGNSTQVSVESDEYLDSRCLPPNFEKNIRELEVIIEETPEIELEKIKELIMLYTLAVEYYDSNNDDKFIYYKNKIVHLHQQANVIKAMNKYIAPPRQESQKMRSPVKNNTLLEKKRSETFSQTISSVPEIPNEKEEIFPQLSEREKEKKHIETKEKMKGFEEKAVVGITDAYVNKLMDIQDENVIEQEIIIEKDLKKQTNNILKRLNKRIKTKEKCSTPPSSSSTKKMDFKIDICKTECSNFDTGVEQYISNAPPKQAMTSRQHRQKPSISVIDSIVANFIADKKKSLSEEKNFKIDQIEFEYEKLSFQLEKSKTVLTEEEKKKLEFEKENKIRLVEEEFVTKEKLEIEIIHQKYYKYDFNKSKEVSPVKPKIDEKLPSMNQISSQNSAPENKERTSIKLLSQKL